MDIGLDLEQYHRLTSIQRNQIKDYIRNNPSEIHLVKDFLDGHRAGLIGSFINFSENFKNDLKKYYINLLQIEPNIDIMKPGLFNKLLMWTHKFNRDPNEFTEEAFDDEYLVHGIQGLGSQGLGERSAIRPQRRKSIKRYRSDDDDEELLIKSLKRI
jgi:hypothetical protein